MCTASAHVDESAKEVTDTSAVALSFVELRMIISFRDVVRGDARSDRA
jgi:hypothetical protein